METDFESSTLEILEIYRMNLVKAIAISELKKEYLDEKNLEGFNQDIEKLEKHIGIVNVARNQAVVMMITSLEAYLKDFFNIMILREDNLKKALRICEKIKFSSEDILKITNDKVS